MCRFLLVRSKEKIKPERLLHQFADMCEKSHAPDGDWQGDGWGVAIGNAENLQGDPLQKLQGVPLRWDIYKSLKPMWENKNTFSKFPETNVFIVHARSAGFPHHRGNIDYNQPYISASLCFVFNGMIKGVKINKPLSGKIGAQKIFSLLLQLQKNKSMDETLKLVDKLLLENSREVTGMNIGISTDDKFYVLCEYKKNPEYFAVRYYQSGELTLVCSEPIGNYHWKMLKKGDIISL